MMKYRIVWLTIFTGVLIWSGIAPKDYFTWFLEVLPAILGLVVLLITYHKFKFTGLTYFFILIHCIILMVGGHYTYAEVPVFDQLAELFGWSRNNYDKLGHVAQGFVPALISREILLRKHVLQPGKWLNVLVVALCMAISVTYEFLEWGVALLTGESAEAFLGTQGYVWDTQSDMLYATLGAIIALLLFSKYQSTQIARITTFEAQNR